VKKEKEREGWGLNGTRVRTPGKGKRETKERGYIGVTLTEGSKNSCGLKMGIKGAERLRLFRSEQKVIVRKERIT